VLWSISITRSQRLVHAISGPQKLEVTRCHGSLYLTGNDTRDNEVVIEVKSDDLPAYMDRTLRDRTGTLIAGQSTVSFSTEGGTVSNIVDVAEGTFTFEK
jgi:hypothetical protein